MVQRPLVYPLFVPRLICCPHQICFSHQICCPTRFVAPTKFVSEDWPSPDHTIHHPNLAAICELDGVDAITP